MLHLLVGNSSPMGGSGTWKNDILVIKKKATVEIVASAEGSLSLSVSSSSLPATSTVSSSLCITMTSGRSGDVGDDVGGDVGGDVVGDVGGDVRGENIMPELQAPVDPL